MLLPRFTIRAILVMVTIAAIVFVVAGMAYRGQIWAWGVTIAIISAAITLLVQAAWFGMVWLLAQMPLTPKETAERDAVMNGRGITK
jgi:hypothetical protein